MEKILFFTKNLAIGAFIVVAGQILLISTKVNHLIGNANNLVNNANSVVNSTKPIVKKSGELVSILNKDAKILDGFIGKVGPLLEKNKSITRYFKQKYENSKQFFK